MAKQSDFNSFLSNIEPSSSTVSYISSVQNTLREYLSTHDIYKTKHVETFLSGSYAKHTAIRPVSSDKKRDVDIVVVTTYTLDDDSSSVLEELCGVLAEKDKYKSAKVQSHSVGVELNGISIDIVPVIADTDDDKLYYVGDSENGGWTKTDPKGHKKWSSQMNADNAGKYVPLVKIFKWWRRHNCPDDIRYPKGITLEKIIADNLGDCSLSTEEFLISTVQNIISSYKEDFCEAGVNPVIEDPSDKIDGNNLLEGYTEEDFSSFISKLNEHADYINNNGTGNDVWREILGKEFPSGDRTLSLFESQCEQECSRAVHKQHIIWPFQRGGAAFVTAKVYSPNGIPVDYKNNGLPLEKGCRLIFHACTGVKPPFKVMWQIVNTGKEATLAGCLRGGFDVSNCEHNGRRESTEYAGSHSVQCFIIKNGICVAKSKEYIINIK